jgi:acyl carrier protein
MSDPKPWDRVRALLSYHSGTPETALNAQSSPQNTPGWDSVANLGLMSALEDEFGVMVSSGDVMRLRTLGDIVEFVAGAPAKTGPGTA